MSSTEREQRCLADYAAEVRREDPTLFRALSRHERPRASWPSRAMTLCALVATLVLVAAITGIPLMPLLAWLAIFGIGWVSLRLANAPDRGA